MSISTYQSDDIENKFPDVNGYVTRYAYPTSDVTGENAFYSNSESIEMQLADDEYIIPKTARVHVKIKAVSGTSIDGTTDIAYGYSMFPVNTFFDEQKLHINDTEIEHIRDSRIAFMRKRLEHTQDYLDKLKYSNGLLTSRLFEDSGAKSLYDKLATIKIDDTAHITYTNLRCAITKNTGVCTFTEVTSTTELPKLKALLAYSELYFVNSIVKMTVNDVTYFGKVSAVTATTPTITVEFITGPGADVAANALTSLVFYNVKQSLPGSMSLKRFKVYDQLSDEPWPTFFRKSEPVNLGNCKLKWSYVSASKSNVKQRLIESLPGSTDYSENYTISIVGLYFSIATFKSKNYKPDDSLMYDLTGYNIIHKPYTSSTSEMNETVKISPKPTSITLSFANGSGGTQYAYAKSIIGANLLEQIMDSQGIENFGFEYGGKAYPKEGMLRFDVSSSLSRNTNTLYDLYVMNQHALGRMVDENVSESFEQFLVKGIYLHSPIQNYNYDSNNTVNIRWKFSSKVTDDLSYNLHVITSHALMFNVIKQNGKVVNVVVKNA